MAPRAAGRGWCRADWQGRRDPRKPRKNKDRLVTNRGPEEPMESSFPASDKLAVATSAHGIEHSLQTDKLAVVNKAQNRNRSSGSKYI
jgi:hypothetical protein